MLGCALLALVPALPQPLAPSDVCVIRRASLDAGGAQASGHSRKPSISADGAWVAFESEAPDLVQQSLVDLLLSDDLAARQIAIGALEARTGERRGYEPEASLAERTAAVARWNE